MKTTLKQQMNAVSLARNYVSKKTSIALNDAASTLAAVNFIGEEKIRALPDILTALNNLYIHHDYMMAEGEEGNYIEQVELLRVITKGFDLPKGSILPQLLAACKVICDDIGYDNEIGEILKQLKV